MEVQNYMYITNCDDYKLHKKGKKCTCVFFPLHDFDKDAGGANSFLVYFFFYIKYDRYCCYGFYFLLL